MREIKVKNDNDNININNYKKKSITYENFKVQERLYKYCWKCGKDLDTPSSVPFCCWECHQDFYKELAQDMDDIVGIN